MNKLSCCPDSYLGIKEEYFKEAIIAGILENGQPIPCLSCGCLYLIKNYSLVFLRELNAEEKIFLLKESATEIMRRVIGNKEPITKDADFMKALGIKW